MCGHRTGPRGFHMGLGTPVRLCMRASCEPVRMPYTGLGISVLSGVPGGTGPDEARERTFVLCLSVKTRLCYTRPIGPAWPPQDGLWAFYRQKIVERPGSNIFETSCGPTRHALWLPTGSHGLGPYGTPNYPGASCDIDTKHPMLSEHETCGWSPARRTWGDVGVCGPWKVRTKSPSCLLLVISTLWP